MMPARSRERDLVAMPVDGAIRVPDGTVAAGRCGSPTPTVVDAGLPCVAKKRWVSACAASPSVAQRVVPSSGARRHAARPCEAPFAGSPCAVPQALTSAARHAEPLLRAPRKACRLHAAAVLRLLPAYQPPTQLPAAACLFVFSSFPPPGRVPSFNRLNGGGFINRRFPRGDVMEMNFF